jgi:DNA repair protein RadC
MENQRRRIPLSGANPPHYAGHRQRIKAKYLRNGLDGWYEYEVLELLLSFAIPRKDTKPIAKTLLAAFGSLGNVLDADTGKLTAIEGVSLHSALLLKLSKDVAAFYLKKATYKKDLIASPEAALNYLRTLLKGSANEEFHALFLDAANHLIAAEIMRTGTVNRSAVYPRKLAERALACHAVGVILSHNHPAGTLRPSDDDIRATDAVAKALSALDIAILDHLIIAGDGYFSFKENGLV